MRKLLLHSLLALSLVASSASATLVTFEEAVNAALEQAYDVQRAKIDLLSAKNDRNKTFAQMSPYGTFIFQDITNDQELVSGDIVLQGIKSRQAQVQMGVSLTALVAGLVKIWSQGKGVELSEDKKRQIIIDTAFAVAEAYRLGQQAIMAVDVAKGRLATARKQQKDAEALYSYGKISKGDRLEVDLSYNNAVLALANAQNKLIKDHTTLKKLLGIQEDGLLELEKLKDLDATMVVQIPEQADAVREAMKSRSDLLVSRQTVDTLSSGKWLTISSYLPLVNVNYNWQWNFGALSSFVKTEFESLTLNLTWNFWDGGAALTDFRKIALQANRASIDLREKIFDVRNDAEQSVRELELARETLRLRDVGLAQAKEAYRGFQARFAMGAVTVTELLFSEGTLNQAELDHLAATVGLDIANMKLQKALGKKRPVPL